MRVTVVGLGKVGAPLAEHLLNLGHQVVGYDISLAHVKTNHPFITDVSSHAYQDADAAILIVPTPQEGDRISSEYIRKAGTDARARMRPTAKLFIASTLDPLDAADTCRQLEAIYTPVFVRLGSVLQDLQEQKYLLVGTTEIYSHAQRDSMLLWDWNSQNSAHRNGPVVLSDPTTIACAKLAINATLSLRIGWANDVALRAKHFGADPEIVCKIIGLDPRIGPDYHAPGWPPSGPCIPRDLLTWMSVPGFGVAEAAMVSHRSTQRRILNEVLEQIGAIKEKPKVLVIGLTYKSCAHDYTNAFGFTVACELARRGYDVRAYDREGTTAEFMQQFGVHMVGTGESTSDTDVVVIGFPGYPEEMVKTAYNWKGVVINPW